MAITEVFPNPTVKSVHFEIRYPNLFFIERLMGEIQLKLMKEFPESKLLLQRQFFIAQGPEGIMKKPPEDIESEPIGKIWNFKSPSGMEVNIKMNSLGILSTRHKTYQNKNVPERFRDLIESVVGSFLSVINLPIITRIGLRYIDECPIPKKNNEDFEKWYNSSFPLRRFELADALDMKFITTVKKGSFWLRYEESLKQENGKDSLILDFDGSAEQIESNQFLTVTDKLHEVISNEYESTAKKPLFEYMKKS